MPLLTSVSALMRDATVDSLGQPLGMCMYCALAGNPSSGKTAAIDLCKMTVREIEKFADWDKTSTILRNPPTVESLCKLMAKNPHLLGKTFIKQV